MFIDEIFRIEPHPGMPDIVHEYYMTIVKTDGRG
jgi:hypothetical protein